MPVLERVSVPCDGATLLVEDVLSGIDIYLQAPDGSRHGVVSVEVEEGKIVAVTDHTLEMAKNKKDD